MFRKIITDSEYLFLYKNYIEQKIQELHLKINNILANHKKFEKIPNNSFLVFCTINNAVQKPKTINTMIKIDNSIIYNDFTWLYYIQQDQKAIQVVDLYNNTIFYYNKNKNTVITLDFSHILPETLGKYNYVLKFIDFILYSVKLIQLNKIKTLEKILTNCYSHSEAVYKMQKIIKPKIQINDNILIIEKRTVIIKKQKSMSKKEIEEIKQKIKEEMKTKIQIFYENKIKQLEEYINEQEKELKNLQKNILSFALNTIKQLQENNIEIENERGYIVLKYTLKEPLYIENIIEDDKVYKIKPYKVNIRSIKMYLNNNLSVNKYYAEKEDPEKIIHHENIKEETGEICLGKYEKELKEKIKNAEDIINRFNKILQILKTANKDSSYQKYSDYEIEKEIDKQKIWTT